MYCISIDMPHSLCEIYDELTEKKSVSMSVDLTGQNMTFEDLRSVMT